MRIDPLQLLKKLEPPVRPSRSPGAVAPGRVPLEAQSFGDLLGLVSTGQVRSGRAIDVSATLPEPLTGPQQQRLAAAADLAEANGVGTALMLIDGRAMIMDVLGRAVTSELSSEDPTRLVPIEAAVLVAGEADLALSARPPRPGDGVVPPAMIAQLLASRSMADPAGHDHTNEATGPHRAAG